MTRARGIRAAFPDLDASQIPMAASVRREKVLYLLDPVGASRRSAALRAADVAVRAARFALRYECDAVELPYTPAFLHKQDGFVFSMGQLMQWMSGQVLSTGTVQIWPATPVASALVEGRAVKGVRLVDQGVDRLGNPEGAFMPGMDVTAALTVVGDGPVGAVGRQLDRELGLPPASHGRRDWAVGMKFVVDLPEGTPLEPGTVLHTLGFPEPEIFGFLYVHPDRVASVGIFVPSWFESPVRTSYRYLQHYVQHPYLWRFLKDAKLRSWGAKSILESGRRGEPLLAGDGFARIGEGSGSTNVLTSSGVDEAFTTGVLLGEGVIALLEAGKPLTKENLDAAYVARRRASWIEAEGRVAEKARDGFQKGVVTGLLGMALAGAHEGEGRARRGAGPPGGQGRFARDVLRREDPCRGDRRAPPRLRGEGRAAPRRAHGPRRLAGGAARRKAPRHPAGRPPRRRQGPGAARLRGPRHLPEARALPRVRAEGVLRDLLGGGDPPGRGRGPRVRPREVRPLRRLPVELHAAD